jgi:mannose-6-phosphate isomerase-like protein (cupin superfamily)
MKVSSKNDGAPALSRGDGVVSHLLHSEGDGKDGTDTDLTVTWVDVEPGESQVVHSHEPEQVYVIVAGKGRMRVGDEERDVGAGDAVHIPSKAEHGIENTGEETLEYVSAATPAIPHEQVEEFYEDC